IAGRLVHTGAPVVLWFDPGGYDAYRVENRFGPTEESGWEMIKDKIGSPNRYGVRDPGPASPARGWTLEDVRHRVDQFVLHYDVCGTSRQCFKVLHDERGLSVHFLLDVDGTIYQTLDLKDKAWHATKANDRSVGVEIASIGAYPSVEGSPLADWYTRDGQGTRITFPTWLDDPGVRTPGFIARPASAAPIEGEINGHSLVQYDFTPQQYDSLTKLTAALCAVLAELRCDYPRGTDGTVLDRVMTPPEFEHYRGVLGHWHVQDNKIDPGPAMDWDRVIDGARWLLRE
ncbi:MAG: N-acetylmuramoyl-L-alanine amidase, partial [Phycisphaerales bacterium]|nr:N-acetylmuramoyl-L-alanine amidase [Phycisphaerales bacterium]